MTNSTITKFASLEQIADHFRKDLTGNNRKEKDLILLFTHNGTGKTRLSMEFKQLGKKFDADGNVTDRDTLYVNAFTEDLFSWNNDLENDTDRALKLNSDSAFFNGLRELDLNSKIEAFFHNYTDIQFSIDYAASAVHFSRSILVKGNEKSFLKEYFRAFLQNMNFICLKFFYLIIQRRPYNDDTNKST
ncbi:MAG: hypothetical protein ACTTH7_05480 [Treponema sp.]